jgi:GH15 family glucan-1,4-alpha-glucosidase
LLQSFDVAPRTLRQYAMLADGERGALVGPEGHIAYLCAPRWHDDAVFSSLLGGGGRYAVTPLDRRHVWGGHYEDGSLIWRSRWVTTRSIVECREALAAPGDPDRVVLLRRIEAHEGMASVHVELECRAGFGHHGMSLRKRADGTWEGRSGDLYYRWTGAPSHTRLKDGRLWVDVAVQEGDHHDLVLELSRQPLTDDPPDAEHTWAGTEQFWSSGAPDVTGSAAPGESLHSWAVLRGLTSTRGGGMVAAATTSLPERADLGRDYDYRYVWIRDQCLAGQAAAVAGADDLLDAAVCFVRERVLTHGADLRPAYTVAGDEIPRQRRLPVPGYPGAPAYAGNRAGEQFQLDVFGEVLLLMAAADSRGRLDEQGWQIVRTMAQAVRDNWGRPDAGIWELDDRHWAHSRLICAAGLRRTAERARLRGRTGTTTAATWEQLADALVADVDRDCLHPSGRWQRSPEDPGVDASLLLPGVRGAVPPTDQRVVRTVAAVRDCLSDDGYVYRFRHDGSQSLHAAEGSFLLSGFDMSLAELAQGRTAEALRWFERNRGALGPPGLFTEEFDVVQRQLRGNLPQAFVHAAALETAQRLGEAGVHTSGFDADDR